MGFHVREVWNENLEEEVEAVEQSLGNYPVVSVDAEFPGFLRSTPRTASEEERFGDLKYNVGRTSVIQLGVTLANVKGTVGRIWQFNFEFDVERDESSEESIEFLKRHGVDFEKLRMQGIERLRFDTMFGAMMGRIKESGVSLTWVTFHGVYDLAHIMKAVSLGGEIPDSSAGFAYLLGVGMDAVVDVKYMAKFYEEAWSEVGLQKLAEAFGVRRRGNAHTAGSDSLMTALVYFKLKKKLKQMGVEQDKYLDFIYGISTRIARNHPIMMHQEQQQKQQCFVIETPKRLVRCSGVFPSSMMICVPNPPQQVQHEHHYQPSSLLSTLYEYHYQQQLQQQHEQLYYTMLPPNLVNQHYPYVMASSLIY